MDKAQTQLPIFVYIFIGVIVVFVGYLILQTNVGLKDKDIEVFIVAFAIALLAFVWATMRGDKLRMEGV